MQCKTNFFFHLCFYGRNLQQFEEHFSREASINKSFFDSFALVYTRLVTRLHSSILVYTLLHLSTLVCFFIIDQKYISYSSICSSLFIFFSKKISIINGKLYSNIKIMQSQRFFICTYSWLLPFKRFSCSTGYKRLTHLFG